MFIDTHCHLDMIVQKEFDTPIHAHQMQQIADVLDVAHKNHVEKIITIGTSLTGSANAIAVAHEYDSVYATIGIHPCDAQELGVSGIITMKDAWHRWLKEKEKHKIVALGEIGLDFYHKPYNKGLQENFFTAQLDMAVEYCMPVIIHMRDATDETLAIVEPYAIAGLRGVIHCFGHGIDVAQKVMSWGWFVGLDGPITYPKNDALRAVVKDIPLECIVLETDAPFLPPQPFRGKPNVPAYIPLIAKEIATVKGCSIAVVEETTTRNAITLFGLG